jgi:hypothetical protein
MRHCRSSRRRAELTAVPATVTHLATKAELADARTQIANVRTALATTEVRLIRRACCGRMGEPIR